jgi:hypothetical protein
MERSYRMKRSYFYLGLTWVIICSLILCILVPLSFLNKTCPPRMGYFFASVGLFFLAIATYLLVVSIRHRLCVTEKGVERRGIFKTQSIDFEHLTEARWGCYSELGKLILQTPDDKVVVEFAEYSREQGRELVRFFRYRLPEPMQREWERYWHHYWPKFEEPDTSNPEENREATRKMRLRLFYIFLSGYFLIALCAFFVWRYLHPLMEFSEIRRQIGGILGNAFLLLILGGWMIYSVSGAVGKVRKQYPLERKGEGLMKFGFVGALMAMPVCLGLSLWLGIFSLKYTAGFIICILLMLFFVILMFQGMHKTEKSVKQWKAEGAKIAEELYMKPMEETEKNRR